MAYGGMMKDSSLFAIHEQNCVFWGGGAIKISSKHIQATATIQAVLAELTLGTETFQTNVAAIAYDEGVEVRCENNFDLSILSRVWL